MDISNISSTTSTILNKSATITNNIIFLLFFMFMLSNNEFSYVNKNFLNNNIFVKSEVINIPPLKYKICEDSLCIGYEYDQLAFFIYDTTTLQGSGDDDDDVLNGKSPGYIDSTDYIELTINELFTCKNVSICNITSSSTIYDLNGAVNSSGSAQPPAIASFHGADSFSLNYSANLQPTHTININTYFLLQDATVQQPAAKLHLLENDFVIEFEWFYNQPNAQGGTALSLSNFVQGATADTLTSSNNVTKKSFITNDDDDVGFPLYIPNYGEYTLSKIPADGHLKFSPSTTIIAVQQPSDVQDSVKYLVWVRRPLRRSTPLWEILLFAFALIAGTISAVLFLGICATIIYKRGHSTKYATI